MGCLSLRGWWVKQEGIREFRKIWRYFRSFWRREVKDGSNIHWESIPVYSSLDLFHCLFSLFVKGNDPLKQFLSLSSLKFPKKAPHSIPYFFFYWWLGSSLSHWNSVFLLEENIFFCRKQDVQRPLAQCPRCSNLQKTGFVIRYNHKKSVHSIFLKACGNFVWLLWGCFIKWSLANVLSYSWHEIKS